MSEGRPLQLAKGWATANLGEISARDIEKRPPVGDSPVVYIDIGSIDRDRKEIVSPQSVTSETAPTRARQWVETGDVLVSMTRPNLNAVAMISEALNGAVASTGFDVLRIVGVDPRWVYYRVRTDGFVAEMCDAIQGVVYPAVRPSDIRTHELPIPPLPEQSRIVAAIEFYLSRLDAADAALERVRRNLARYRASVLNAAVTGQLVPTEAEIARAEGCEYEPASVLLARILDERRRRWEEAELAKMAAAGNEPKDDRWKAKYKVPVAPETEGLGALPEGWVWASLDSLITLGPQNGLYVPQSRYGIGVPILRINDYQTHWSRCSQELQRVNIEDSVMRKYLLVLDDLVINRVNSPSHLGKCLVIEARHLPAVFESNMMRLRLTDQVNTPFIRSWLSSIEGRRHLTLNAKWAVNQASINQKDIARTPVPIAPITEQRRAVAESERLLSVIDESMTAHSANNTRLSRLRQSILRMAFEGRLVDQDPNDEPAAVLLERIRAERTSTTPSRRGRSRRAIGKTQERLL